MPLEFLSSDETREFNWPVTVDVPGDEGLESQQFTARFIEVSQEELDSIFEQPRSDNALIKRVLIGWGEVVDTKKKPVAYSEAARDAMIARPYVRSAIAQAYVKAILGQERILGN